MPWSFKPKPENVMVKPEVQARVVELARQNKARGVRLLREETGLPLTFAAVLVNTWLEEK
ncbi:hypothetical protein SAMN05660748_0703 [Blastococcus aggregatus]|uniref:Uncharacterized protein n=1 Tax=Blastococcus aggregatus TaxID=38502 RepID=A0A285V3Z1_9ACTN|nr:hypothetical protein [Blastococcus aggregatus]SOC47231.1 hypothetical protein SAMN05660748_0703 [Blastococcus aggregatus]